MKWLVELVKTSRFRDHSFYQSLDTFRISSLQSQYNPKSLDYNIIHSWTTNPIPFLKSKNEKTRYINLTLQITEKMWRKKWEPPKTL